MSKKYHHVFAFNPHRSMWFHESACDTKEDARTDCESLRNQGHKVRTLYSDRTPKEMCEEFDKEQAEYEQAMSELDVSDLSAANKKQAYASLRRAYPHAVR